MSNYTLFIKNISQLLAGSGMAQAITIVATIFIARVYSPENFSDFGIFTASIALMLTIGTGRLDLALIQVDRKKELSNILFSSITILLLSSVSFLFFTIVIYDFGFNLTNIFLIFFGFILTGLTQIYSNLYSSLERYGEIGELRIITAITFGVTAFTLGKIGDFREHGLLFSSCAAHLLCVILFIAKTDIKFSLSTFKTFKSVIIEYKDYWSLDTLSSLMNTLGRQLPLLIFPSLLGSTIAGYYFFSQRIVAAPVNLIANSVGNVFRKRATREYQIEGNFKKIFIFTFFRLLGLCFIGLIFVLIFLDERLVEILFGNQWNGMLNILFLVIIFYSFKFVISPLTYSFYIIRRLHWNLIGQFFYLLMLFLPILIGYKMNLDPVLIILLHVIGACIAYSGYLVASYICASEIRGEY